MKIVFYGLTITSSWGNGHATTYRSLLKALARRGHQLHFVEKNVEWYRSNRDMPEPPFTTVHLYEEWSADSARLLALSADADVIVIGSYFPDAIAATIALAERARQPILFYDIDTPITLAQLRATGRTDYLDASLIPAYAAYLSFTGGPALRELESRFGAQRAIAFYCSVDPDTYRPTAIDDAFRCDLSYLGTYAADRQPKLMRLLDSAAALEPAQAFLIAGPQYPPETAFQPNVRRLVHVSPRDHPAFYSSSRLTLTSHATTWWPPAGPPRSASLRPPPAARPSSQTHGPASKSSSHQARRSFYPQTPRRSPASCATSPTPSVNASASAPVIASSPHTPLSIARQSSKPSWSRYLNITNEVTFLAVALRVWQQLF